MNQQQGLSICVTLSGGGFLASIKIPDRYKPGLAVLAALSDDVFEKVAGSLSAMPPAEGEKELNAWLSSEANGISPSDLQSLVQTLASLYRLRVKYGVKAEALAIDVAEAASNDAFFKQPTGALKNRLVRLLGIDALNLVDVKAKELQTEAEHIFCEARMITDLRPVFGSNVTDSPEAMIIVHTLKLGYHDFQSQTHREMYVAMDADDIAKLIEVLQRAEKKTKTLKDKMASIGMRLLDLP